LAVPRASRSCSSSSPSRSRPAARLIFSVRNSQNILVAIIPVLLLGLGQTFVIIAAGIDLSVGWVMSLASVLSALALRSAFDGGVPLFPSVLIGLIAAVGGAAVVGLVNGVIIAKLKVPAFIVTLGTSFIVRGIAYLMSENTTVIDLPSGIRAYGNDLGPRRRPLFP
jgi:ribose/xylose/arabinose/galactoside ABC-type transport system permease subunit